MKPKKDSLGDRMKTYEAASKTYLTCRTPVIIRIDGKAFHTFTKGFKKPFDHIFVKSMQETMRYLCQNIQGCVFGYTQSDEISLVLVDYTNLESCAWFDNQVQKIVSVAASMATMAFSKAFDKYRNEYIEAVMELQDGDIESDYLEALWRAEERGAMFDARAFNLPKEEVANYILWRQQDASRNSVNSVAQAHFSHKELQGKSNSQMQDMLFIAKGINWNDFPTYLKRGTACRRETFNINNGVIKMWMLDYNMPVITQDRNYVESRVII